MSEEKILSGELFDKSSSESVIAGEQPESNTQPRQDSGITTLKDRIAASTLAGGLKQLPDRFDQQKGDWEVIKSTNPFEVLYLDYKKYKLITPEIVTGNYFVLEKFWKAKGDMMNTGSNKTAFKDKYGNGIVEYSVQKLKREYEKIKNKEGIEQYYEEINNERLKKGEEHLKDTLENILLNGRANQREMQLCLDRGLKYDLTNEETARIILKTFEINQFRPYGTVIGNTLLEKLFSVENWMTQRMIDEEDRLKIERERTRIQILPGKYATTTEAIGKILFDDPVEAKEYIQEDLLKSAVAQKDMVLAKEVGAISKSTSDIHAAFLQIVYKLNNTLPFRFADNQYANTVEELCSITFYTELSFKQGKEHFKKGYTETWLKETNKDAYGKFVRIRDAAASLDLAFLEFVYTFGPSLPYRFAAKQIIKTPGELFAAINKSRENWEAGVIELYDGSIPVWLKTTNKAAVKEKWESIKNNHIENKHVGLEEFLHLLDENARYARLKVDKEKISFPEIQAGQKVEAELVFTNETRGYQQGTLSFSSVLEGVSLSTQKMSHNAAAGLNTFRVVLTIDSARLIKGVAYQTTIVLNSSTCQQMEIPVSFNIVFPKNAFLIETAKFAGLFAVVFVLARLLVASTYPDWLRNSFDFFLDWDRAVIYFGDFSLFGWAFFLFLIIIMSGAYFFVKYLLKK
ncbi:MAG: hypothetical protein WKF97_05035 [Chitinophagaceae bacterium]